MARQSANQRRMGADSKVLKIVRMLFVLCVVIYAFLTMYEPTRIIINYLFK